ncbi:hypothetical protein IT6_06140 [Methylacidiphilum caldifontis]|uniref:hypothetical protein n=1 Tax=Methylacidiphilum caldifontis TaxID=2795386 RepID=UPI001A90689A|nr:hypothetical protein [Methylacidiphilum caldifontis]QSR87982.1 hypothetical protein IT6_06140 [Methylacidiphilum caldifontis]
MRAQEITWGTDRWPGLGCGNVRHTGHAGRGGADRKSPAFAALSGTNRRRTKTHLPQGGSREKGQRQDERLSPLQPSEEEIRPFGQVA